MKVEMLPTIDLFNLEDALSEEYKENFDELASLLWGSVSNDSYKKLYFRNFNNKNARQEKYSSFSNPEDTEKRNKIYTYLAKLIPEQYDKVLIDISW